MIHDQQGAADLVIFHIEGTASALDARVIANSDDVGATGVFSSVVNGQMLRFVQEGKHFIDMYLKKWTES